MAGKSSQSKAPRDNASLAGLFDLDFFPSEGAAIGGQVEVFLTAAKVLEHSGIATHIEQWRSHDRAGKRPGPTPWLSETQVVALMLVLTLSRRAPLFTELRDLLRHASPEALATIRVSVPEETSDVALYHRAYNSYRRLVDLLNPEPGSLYRLLAKEELRTLIEARDEAECATKRARAHTFLNALLWGTWMLLPRKVRREARGDVAVDATIIKAAARGRGHRSPYCSSDPEAGWYKRDGNHDGERTSRAATTYQRRAETLIWGRELHTAVPYGQGVPAVVLGASFDVPGKRLPENALRALDAPLGHGLPAGHSVSDRAYLPGTKPVDLALPLRARGYQVVFDYARTSTDMGQQASQGGALLVEGRWYCPSMPQPLINASIDFFLREHDDPLRIDEQTYAQRLAQRERYALRSKERPDEEGHRRLACPAVGASATVSCPRRESHPRAADRPRARVLALMLVNPAPKVCEQQTMTFPPSVGAKHEQTYPYRSAQWQDHFTTGRQSVESVNKSIKDGRFIPVDDPELRPRRGFVAQLFSLAVMVAATNVRKIIAWLHEQVGISTISTAPVRHARRRDLTKGWSVVPNAPPLSADA